MEIAENRLKTFSWSTVENGQIVEVKDFLVLDQPRTVQLLPHSRDKPLELIPYYYITFYLNKVYPGNINGIGVGIWADTGEVRDCQTLTID